ncbi:pyridoxal phosphate-dependent aminotransferase [Caloramator proteoclasticus]|uniref:Aminotransferase n=1 Tax=Caloramator proteoclasticus DSM 10124 TaxID=1121262 RepID=A0A1M4SPP6_9CLOT|nr:pyridoxal phosphate-dependent aminotransferase [Caloramator proteoclasticus]SHE34244.1 aspartate aminotransferase [Caloramator proteoclasticus DSM 10124]
MELSKKAKQIAPSTTLAITAKAKKMKSEGINVISFGAGEPDFDTPQYIKDAAIDAINNGLTRYTPASGIIELKEAICNKLRKENGLEYSANEIVISNGAKHSIYNALMAICNPGDEVIIPVPYWVSYPELAKLVDAIPVFIHTDEKNQFKINIEELKNKITPKTKAIIINSPSNPTGTVYTEEELSKIAEIVVENDLIVISDEIYEKLIYDGYKHISIAYLNKDIKERTIVINGMSKAYAMTGWRIGYTASNKEIASLMANIQSHATSNPNTIAQYASVEALRGNQKEIEIMRKEFEKRRNFMVDRINKISGLTCVNPLGAFYVMVNITNLKGKMFNGKSILTSLDFANVLLEEEKVAVIPGDAFGDDNYIRLSFATSLEQIKEGLDRIDSFIQKIK